VEVLVVGDTGHHRIAGRVLHELAGVAVGHPGGELLQGDVHEACGGARRMGHLAAAHLAHAGPLELDRVERAGHGEVVADDDGVAVLLGGPAPGPLAPDGVVAEHPEDGVRVVRQVVLGQEVDEEGAAHLVGQAGLGRVPRLVGFEVAAPAPRHQLVGEPLLAGIDVSGEEPLGHGLELVQESDVVHGCQDSALGLPTSR
jgi:hypothetical protein